MQAFQFHRPSESIIHFSGRAQQVETLTKVHFFQTGRLATGPRPAVLHRDPGGSVVGPDLDHPEEGLQRGAAECGPPPRAHGGAAVLGHAEGEPPGHPGTGRARWRSGSYGG